MCRLWSQSPLFPVGAREIDAPTSHADLIPTLLGLVGIDHDEALAKLRTDHIDARPLVGRDLSDVIRATTPKVPSDPILFTTDDEISEGSMPPASPFQRFARKLHVYETIKQPNHLQTVIAEVDVGGATHLVKFSRYFDNQQFWTVPPENGTSAFAAVGRTRSPNPSPRSSSSTTSRSTRSRSATLHTRATPTMRRARFDGRYSGSSSSSSPRNDSRPQRASGPATNRQRFPDHPSLRGVLS